MGEWLIMGVELGKWRGKAFVILSIMVFGFFFSRRRRDTRFALISGGRRSI